MRALAENWRQRTANEKVDSSENELVEYNSPSMPTKREDANQLHLRDVVTSFLS